MYCLPSSQMALIRVHYIRKMQRVGSTGPNRDDVETSATLHSTTFNASASELLGNQLWCTSPSTEAHDHEGARYASGLVISVRLEHHMSSDTSENSHSPATSLLAKVFEYKSATPATADRMSQ